MKILKHGNLKQRKFTCAICGCEFVVDMREYQTVAANGIALWHLADCPECGNETSINEIWEEQNEHQ